MRAAWWVAFIALPSLADDGGIRAWVHERVAQQRTDAWELGPKPWRERSKKGVPGFQPPTSLAPLVKAVRPAVVNVAARKEGAHRSVGSGFLISAEGLVVTNSHVVEGAEAIEVRLADEQVLSAAVVGSDTATDVALLRVAAEGALPTVALGDSDSLDVGDWVVAIGNPFGLDWSVTHGLISARERVLGVGPYDDFLQTDVLINPGNSGGPIFDMHGDVVGVTTAIAKEGQGIGFAVPINLVKDLLPNLLQNGRLKRGWLGLSVREVEGAGVSVTDVVPGSPAEQSGLRVGDVLMALQGKPILQYRQLLRRVALLPPGTSLPLEIERAGRPLRMKPVLAERPGVESP